MVVVFCTCGAWVGLAKPNGLKAGLRVRKDTYPVVRNKRCKRRVYGDQFRPRNGAGLFRARGIDVDSSVGGNVYPCRP